MTHPALVRLPWDSTRTDVHGVACHVRGRHAAGGPMVVSLRCYCGHDTGEYPSDREAFGALVEHATAECRECCGYCGEMVADLLAPAGHGYGCPGPRPLGDVLAELGAFGECRFDPELHTGPDAFEVESPGERLAREDVAREVCGSCPVWDSCLRYALRTRPAYGIWAGLRAGEISALAGQVRGEVGRGVRGLGEVA